MATQGEEGNKLTELSYREKVPVAAMKEIIHDCLVEKLTNQQYEGEKCNEAAKTLADTIRNRLKNLGYDRYKFVVQVLIGERREQGIYFGSRCFWDVNTDNQASESFTNVSNNILLCLFLHVKSNILFFVCMYVGSHILHSDFLRHLLVLNPIELFLESTSITHCLM